MARFGNASLAAATDTLLLTVPANEEYTVFVQFVTRSGAANVRLAWTTGGAPALADYLEYDANLSATGTALHITGLVMSAGEALYARADTANVTVTAWGRSRIA